MKNQVKYFYECAEKAGMDFIQKEALKILRAHPRLIEFEMAMGSATFTTKYREFLNVMDEDHPKYMDNLSNFLDDWDDVYHFTGEEMVVKLDKGISNEV